MDSMWRRFLRLTQSPLDLMLPDLNLPDLYVTDSTRMSPERGGAATQPLMTTSGLVSIGAEKHSDCNYPEQMGTRGRPVHS